MGCVEKEVNDVTWWRLLCSERLKLSDAEQTVTNLWEFCFGIWTWHGVFMFVFTLISQLFRRRRGSSYLLTFKTMCRRYWRPLLPGYFPLRLAGDRLIRLAPVSVHKAWSSIFFPTPDGPASSSERIRGPLSCTHWEPERCTTAGSFVPGYDQRLPQIH